jgi:tryptophan synthase alpha chain
LVGFVSLGDYGVDFSRRLLPTLADAGCDVIELALPFSDPMADGPVLQASYERALRGAAQPIDLASLFALAKDFRSTHPDTPLVLYSYLNPILQHGMERFGADALAAGIDGLIIVDLPVEEASLLEPLAKLPLDFAQLVAPTTPADRLAKLLTHHQGLVYAIAVAGVTGQKSADMASLRPYLDAVRSYTSQPVFVGFGIKTAEQAAALADTSADAVVVASALINSYHQAFAAGDSVEQALAKTAAFVTSLKQAI